ncbi:tetracycline-efflux transporter [Histoplasma capsulatum]|uniref:Tetracycline-efflux transporter n=1 Tax=Ajellomyces capsulatus TaxID=5037 RepID=A0A8A1MP82_AJECA|nr:tetracycline-efflux transporter [Histoplasma capsulatum]
MELLQPESDGPESDQGTVESFSLIQEGGLLTDNNPSELMLDSRALAPLLVIRKLRNQLRPGLLGESASLKPPDCSWTMISQHRNWSRAAIQAIRTELRMHCWRRKTTANRGGNVLLYSGYYLHFSHSRLHSGESLCRR